MATYTLKENELEDFVQNKIIPLCISSSSACIFALAGELGAGKTTFSKIFLKEIGVTTHVQSPTFTIMQSYDISFNSFSKIVHIDLYRLEDKKELEILKYQELFNDPKTIILIEWADKFKQIIPQSDNAHWIHFEHDTVETRKITITHD